MSASDYIDSLKKKQPEIFRAKKITIKVENFELHLRCAFQAGFNSGKETKSLFESIFGRTPRI